MKCKTCKKPMQSVLIQYDFEHNGKAMTALNVPALHCPQCGNTEIPEAVKANLQRFACESEEITIDYTKCEEEEAANITVTVMQSLLW